MKKRLLTLSITFLVALLAQAQIKAITEDGEEVFLYDNGTWKYKDFKELEENQSLPINSIKFEKSEESTFQIKSKKNDMSFYFNPKKWTFQKAENNEDAEFELQYKEGDLYGMIITEAIEIPIETLQEIALENAQAAAPDAKIVNAEYRIVNGKKMLYMEIDGTIKGIKFSYVGYYYSNENGTTQYVTYTTQKLKSKYQQEIEVLLNGIW